MNRTYLFSIVGLGVLLALQSASMVPMNVKVGYWQNTQQIQMAGALGLPPEVAAKLTPEQRQRLEAAMSARAGGAMPTNRTVVTKGCLTAEDLTKNPFHGRDQSEKEICANRVLNSTSSDLELQMSCTGQAQMNYDVKIHAVDPEHTVGDGEGSLTVGGRTMKSSVHMDMKWLGPTCPKDDQ